MTTSNPSSLVGISVTFIDSHYRNCVRVGRVTPRDIAGITLPTLHDVYTTKSGFHWTLTWGLVDDIDIDIGSLPVWPPGQEYPRILSADMREERRLRLGISIPNCTFIVYEKQTTDVTTPGLSDNDIRLLASSGMRQFKLSQCVLRRCAFLYELSIRHKELHYA